MAAGGTGDALDRLIALVADDMEAVNATIVERMASDVPMIPALAGHLIASGGKRLRPILTLAAAGLCGYNGPDHIKLATAVEFIHTATLLHDDVVDNSALRRGRKTAHMIWGNPASVLVGDFLYSRSFQLMVETGSVEILGVLADASAVIAEGEVLQLASAKNLETTEETYLKVIESKTAALFAAAAEVGAMAAKVSPDKVKALAEYGRAIGVAFQLVDDALDYAASSDTMGKNAGDDFREGKITLPVILANARGATDERAFWLRVISDDKQRPEDFAAAVDLIKLRDAIEDTIDRARSYVAAAKDALSVFDDGPHKRALLALADFCVERAY
ncbi:Octaprenyl diphosphate synthase [Alphaproteobacteria bacterium SO-S41]|nr:Octaprenyl diphosphate synthase [Alphaproteobacteria bacterium SO-S41]